MSNFVVVVGPINEIVDHTTYLVAERIEKGLNYIFVNQYTVERKGDTLFLTWKGEEDEKI